MKEKYIVRTYMCHPHEMQGDMNDLAEQGYSPKEISLGKYQNEVDAVVIYEWDGESND